MPRRVLQLLLPFVLLAFAPVAATAVQATPAAEDVALVVGEAQARSLATGETQRFTFDADAGDFVRGRVDQLSVDVAVRILGPDGASLRTLDGPPRGPERFQIETEAAGRHVVEVAPFEEQTGDYVITLERLEPVATEPEQLAEQLLSAYDGEGSPGAIVSVWKDGKTLFTRAFGMANLTYRIPYDADTRCNIGSTSKQFTAFAVLLLVEQGKLSLDDDVRQHLPELPDLGATVTVRHLLTHTTGYREFLNLLTMTGRRLDRGDSIDRAELVEIVQRQPALQNAPGAEFNYNNTAFGLAALIVERLSGQTFPEFMERSVFGPLGMTGTTVRASPGHIIEGRAEGYVPGDDGTYLELGDLGGAVGAGGIYTTVADLQRWVENFAAAKVGRPEMFELMMTPTVLPGGASTGYGLGLFIDEQRGLKRVHHGGGDVAHRSQLVYYPEIDAGLTTQSNHAGFDRSVAFRLAEVFFGEHMEPEATEDDATPGVDGAVDVDADSDATTWDAASWDPAAFDELVGRYALEVRPDFVLGFTREGDELHVQATGQPRLDLVPTSATTYRIVGVEARVTFHRGDDGTVEALTLHQNGDHRATRLADAETTVADLADYVGRYFSAELETFYDVSLADDALVVRHRRLDDITLAPGSTDSFTGDDLTFAFERDRHGRVIGFYLSNVRTRDVRFARVE